jgi:biotin carboxylase
MPGNDVGRLQGRRNKLLMAQYLQEAGLATPRCEVVSSPEEGRRWAYANNLSEVVVKPVDSAASDNVRFCHVDDDLYAACQDVLSASNFFGQGNEAVLVQERLVGREYYVNTVSVNGEHRVAETWQYTKRLGRSPVYDFEEPCDVADCRISTLHTYVKDALTALGIRYGAAHSEVMYTKRGPMLIETGARLGGGVLPWVAAKYSGVSHVGLLARALVDPNQLLRFNESTVLWNHRVRYVSLINHTGGEVTSLQWRDKISSLDSVAAVVSTVLPGDRIVPTVDLATSPGYAYLISESKDSIMRDYRTIRLWEAEGLYTRAA